MRPSGYIPVASLVLLTSTVAFAARPAARSLSEQQQRGDTTVRLATAPRFPGGGTLVPDISIGSETQGPNYLFDRVISVIGARDGSIWVLDGPSTGLAGEYRLRKYDAAGRFITNVSRMGQGPGEFFRPSNPLVELPDGRIAVRDPARNKVDLFHPSGEVSETWMFGTTRLQYTIGEGGAISSDTSGIVYLPTHIARPSARGQRIDPDDLRQPVLVRLRKDGTILDTLWPPDLPKVSLPRASVEQPGGGGVRGGGDAGAGGRVASAAPAGVYTIVYSVPFSPTSNWYVSPLGYVVTMVGTRYAIDLRIPRPTASGRGSPPGWRAGDPVVSIRRNVTPVPIGAAERREQRDSIELRMSRATSGTIVRPLAEMPTVKPVIRNLKFGLDGRIWALLSAPSERYDPAKHGESLRRSARAGWVEPLVYDVFEPSGPYLGQLKLPFDVAPSTMSMRGDVVYAASSGDNGVQVVRRYRVNW
jgi:hypothetical protein